MMTMSVAHILVFLISLAILVTTNSLSETERYHESTIEIEHLISNSFVGRSKYVVKHKGDGNHEINVLDSTRNSISVDQLPEFKNLLINKDLYRIQVITRLSNGLTSSVSAAIPVCDLQQSGFKEDIVLQFDNNDNIMGLSYSSPTMAISQQCNADKVRLSAMTQRTLWSSWPHYLINRLTYQITSEVVFQTRITVATVEEAQPVPLQALGPKPMILNHINFGAEADPNAQPAQSFLRQYVNLAKPYIHPFKCNWAEACLYLTSHHIIFTACYSIH